MQPLLVELQAIDMLSPGLKERIFNWIVDLSQRKFDQLCSELIGLQRFQKKYEGAYVTDAPHLIKPFKSFLPRVELLIELDERPYDRNLFYRWLGEVDEGRLQLMCWELEALCIQVLENIDTYVVGPVDSQILYEKVCWQIDYTPSLHLSEWLSSVQSWKTF